MTKILALYDRWNTTIEVNLNSLISILNDGRHEVKIVESRRASAEDLNWCNACYAIRPASIYMVRIMKAIRIAGKLFVSTYDDDFLELPIGSTERWKKKFVKQCLKDSDVVVTCNPLILKKYKKIAPKPNFIIIDAHVLEKDIKPVPIVDDKIQIVYAAGRDHTELFDQYIKPTLNEVYERFGNRLSLTLMGVEPRLDSLANTQWIELIPSKPLEMYNEYMAGHDFDIGLSPLPDSPFCNRKYFNKYIEYSKNGILGLYSRCLPYTLVVEDGRNGVLVDNSIDCWKKSIICAIDNISEMKKMAKTAQQNLRESFSIEAVRKVWHDGIENKITSANDAHIVTYHRARMQEFIYELLSTAHRVFAHVKSEGLSMTMRRIIKHNA